METYKDHITMTPDMNEERLNTLRGLFPDWFTQEGYLDVNEVKKAANPDSVEETERYEFRWFGKSAAKRNAFTPTRATLHYDAARSVNADTTENIIIEGENLEVLKILSSSYRGKVKCIYIDPPYNTGEDRVYKDDYSEDTEQYWERTESIEGGVRIDTNPDTDGKYHSTWLDLMYSRLFKPLSCAVSPKGDKMAHAWMDGIDILDFVWDILHQRKIVLMESNTDEFAFDTEGDYLFVTDNSGNAYQIMDVDQLMYATREVIYRADHDVDLESDSYYGYDQHTVRQAVATCLRYEGECGWYGLMSPEGRLVTSPAYCSIRAIDRDLYFCETSIGRGVILNSKGQRVE